MSPTETIDVLDAIAKLLNKQRKFVDELLKIQSTCYVPRVCNTPKEAWEALVDHMKLWSDAMVHVSRQMNEYIAYVEQTQPQLLWAGFYEALCVGNRLDLLEYYPEAEKVAAVVEAQKLLRGYNPPLSSADGVP